MKKKYKESVNSILKFLEKNETVAECLARLGKNDKSKMYDLMQAIDDISIVHGDSEIYGKTAKQLINTKNGND